MFHSSHHSTGIKPSALCYDIKELGQSMPTLLVTLIESVDADRADLPKLPYKASNDNDMMAFDLIFPDTDFTECDTQDKRA